MHYAAIVEHCKKTGLYVGHVPGFAGAYSQGETLDELKRNMQEVIELVLEDDEPHGGLSAVNVNLEISRST